MNESIAYREAAKPRVFLSSVFEDEIDGEPKYPPLRRRILDNHRSLPVDVWAYDIRWPKNSETPEPEADKVVDRCFAGVHNCDLFIFLLTGRHGSGVGYAVDPVHTTYLELELFAAAMLQKPVLVLHRRGANPESKLHDVLDLLHRAFPAHRYVIDDDDALYERFRTECNWLAAGNRAPPEESLARLPEWLSRRRSQGSFERELADPRLRFLDGNFRSLQSAADPDKAKLLLDQVSSGMRGDAARPQIMPHGTALFRLWAAMRELMDKDERTLADPTLARLWDRVLGLWSKNASWFGLHGHLWMGPLAAVHSQIDLRRKFAVEAAFWQTGDVREPVGARASALYSVAQRMYSRREKLHQFRMAAALATQAIERDQDASQGALSIRGHAFMQMAGLGHVWKLWEAEADFTHALKLHEQFGTPGAKVGAAMVDLGMCSVLVGRWRSGLAQMQEGVTLMRSDESADGKAFLARGLRSLERGARFAWRRGIAEAAREERRTLATQIQAMDQARDFPAMRWPEPS